MFPLISLEDHFMGQAVLDSPSATAIPNHLFPKSTIDNLISLGKSRVDDMDRGKTQVQVVSHIPAVEPLEICKQVNDQLFEAVKTSKGRYRGFGFLPMGQPSACPDELTRCIKTLGFVGALIPNHAKGRYYDEEVYWPMFERAEELDVPIYLHPTPAANFEHYAGNYPQTIQTLLAGPAIGWHNDIAVHVVRLYASGVFDHYPKLKIIVGHMGETLPFMLDRIEKMLTRKWGTRTRDWMTCWNENVWITTSGMFHLGPMACVLKMTKPDRIMYSLDYPFEDPEEGYEFMMELRKSGMVSEKEYEMIAFSNAKNLLKLDIT